MSKKKVVVFKFDDRSIETPQEGGPYLGMIDGKPYPDALRLSAFDELKDCRLRIRQLEQALREAHSLLNQNRVAWAIHAGPWRDRRDVWNKAVEKVKGGQ